ncbi:hypothetical protein GH714_022956 [Hevea brasiliensis]|uniref:Uncharacterized protein n=1 Tax=Hevea brasiliensis TaxID=3981 RepID=A0A6A6MCE4_HEVBR|nr:hypothetical protein GH714_022956 [Hevea brasiliensis]
MEGPISPAELEEILQRTVEEQGSASGNPRANQKEKTRARDKAEEKIRADCQVREEQDAAYLAALKIEKEKENPRTYIQSKRLRDQFTFSNIKQITRSLGTMQHRNSTMVKAEKLPPLEKLNLKKLLLNLRILKLHRFSCLAAYD